MERAVTQCRKVGVVSDDDYSLPERVAQVEEQFVYLPLGGGIEVSGRLIGKQHGRVVDEGARDGDQIGRAHV